MKLTREQLQTEAYELIYNLKGPCQAYLASAEMQCNDERLNDIYNDIAHKCKKVREMLED